MARLGTASETAWCRHLRRDHAVGQYRPRTTAPAASTRRRSSQHSELTGEMDRSDRLGRPQRFPCRRSRARSASGIGFVAAVSAIDEQLQSDVNRTRLNPFLPRAVPRSGGAHKRSSTPTGRRTLPRPSAAPTLRRAPPQRPKGPVARRRRGDAGRSAPAPLRKGRAPPSALWERSPANRAASSRPPRRTRTTSRVAARPWRLERLAQPAVVVAPLSR